MGRAERRGEERNGKTSRTAERKAKRGTGRSEERNERRDEELAENIHNTDTKKPQEKHTPPQRHKNKKNTSGRVTGEDDEGFMNM